MARPAPESRADISVLDLDRRQYLGWTEHIQKGQFVSTDLQLGSELTRAQMWVSADEYKEDPDIIHKKAF